MLCGCCYRSKEKTAASRLQVSVGGSCSHPLVLGNSLSTTLDSAFEEFHSVPSSKGLKFNVFLLSLAGKTSILVSSFTVSGLSAGL